MPEWRYVSEFSWCLASLLDVSLNDCNLLLNLIGHILVQLHVDLILVLLESILRPL